MLNQEDPYESESKKKFGTLEGVFLPNILTIIGVILFLRQGMVMGEAGLLYGLLIICIAHVVTITTGLSLSAVSTNMHVRTGGAYYIISRSLGLEWGGCIGIPLAVSQTLSIALYTLGFAESLRMLSYVEPLHSLVPVAGYPIRITASLALALMTLISFRGAALVIKTQYVVFALVVLALASIFAGPGGFSEAPHFVGEFPNYSFWQVFAIFFPAVTALRRGSVSAAILRIPARPFPRAHCSPLRWVLPSMWAWGYTCASKRRRRSCFRTTRS